MRWNDNYIYDIRKDVNRCVIMEDRLYVGCFFFVSISTEGGEMTRCICALQNNSTNCVQVLS